MHGATDREFEGLKIVGAETIRRLLTYDVCIRLMRDAMMALSARRTRQPLRSFIALGEGRIFGMMPGALAEDGYFGAKLVSVFHDPETPSLTSHRGIVALFEPRLGRPVCVADAEEVTLIRTASASALATEVLSRPESQVLALLGSGHQAIAHASAIKCVRPLSRIALWGRTRARAENAAREIERRTAIDVKVANSADAALEDADIVCTTTAAAEPILFGRWLKPGMHVNLVGSSGPNAAEADPGAVQCASYFVDSRASALAQAGELRRAMELRLVSESHIRGEIGDVLLGNISGRTSGAEITIYKSLGHSVQDLASVAYLYERLNASDENGATGAS